MDPSNSGSGGDPNPDGGVASPKGYALSGKIMLTAIVVLFTAVLLILFLHLYLRWRVLRRTSSGRRRRRRLVFAGEDPNFPSPADRGLAADVLKSLPVFVFSTAVGDGGGEGDEVVECAVCLAEFEEGEKVRNLPRCGHRFHIECIDMWFRSHATCPLCRAAVEAAPPPVNSAISVHASASEPPPPAERSTSISALCSRCGGEEGIGSSSVNSGGPDLRIEVPARRGEGFRGLEEELGLGFGLGSPGGQGVKSPASRILLLRRLLSRDLKIYRGGSSGAVPDLERGEGAERSPQPPHSPSPPPPPATAV